MTGDDSRYVLRGLRSEGLLMRGDVESLSITGFIGPETHIRVEPPRLYTNHTTGRAQSLDWMVRLGQGNGVDLHVRDTETMERLRDAIDAALAEHDAGETQ